MKAIICDKCERVMVSKKDLENVVKLEMSSSINGSKVMYNEKHLCRICESEFYGWLEGK